METTVERIFNEHRAFVNGTYPSVFTKDDVLFLINRIERELLDSEKEVETIKKKILEVIEDFDYDSNIEFSICDGREIVPEFYTEELVEEIVKVFKRNGGA